MPCASLLSYGICLRSLSHFVAVKNSVGSAQRSTTSATVASQIEVKFRIYTY